MNVRLSDEELALALTHGQIRYDAAIRDDLENRIPGFKPDLGRDVSGAAAEMAVAKGLDRWWTGAESRRAAADVSRSWQVRSTHHRGGHLVVMEEDPTDAYYFLVVLPFPPGRFVSEPKLEKADLEIPGFLAGVACKDRGFWREANGLRKECYWIPQSALMTIESVLAAGLEVAP